MKRLESLNNPLYEKFENKKVNNLAFCMGGIMLATKTDLCAAGDQFTTGRL